MTPNERFEQRMREIREEHQRIEDRIHEEFDRDVRRVLFKAAAFLVLFHIALGVIAWLW